MGIGKFKNNFLQSLHGNMSFSSQICTEEIKKRNQLSRRTIGLETHEDCTEVSKVKSFPLSKTCKTLLFKEFMEGKRENLFLATYI